MKYLCLLCLFTTFHVVSFSQCVLSTGSYTQAEVIACLNSCGCSTIEIPDGNTVTMNGDWDLTSQGDIDIVIYGLTGQLVFPGNGNSLVTLTMTENSGLTFQNPNNPDPIVGGNSNNDPRIVVGTEEYFTSDFQDIIDAGGINPVTLPVKLSFFEVFNSEIGFAELKWQTLSEQQNKGFYIYKNGVEVMFIPGHGNSAQTIDYKWIDLDFSTTTAQYQLIQVDLDGTVNEYSDLVEIHKEVQDFMVSPNPVRHMVSIYSPVKDCTIKITSFDGRLIQLIEANDISRVDLSVEPNGIYFAQFIKGGRTLKTLQVIKQ